MSYLFFGVATLFILVLVWAFYKSKYGIPYASEYFKEGLDHLLRRGHSDGFMIFTHIKSKKFVQFNKYAMGKKNSGIMIGFPKATWSEPYFDDVEKKCKKLSLDYKVVVANGADELDFINIYFGVDTEAAADFMKIIFFDIFATNADDTYHATLENAS